MSTASSSIVNDSHADYSNTHLPDDVVQTIQNFKPMIPNHLWKEVADFTRSAVTDFAPQNRPEASKALTIVSRLAVWTTHVACVPLERRYVFAGRHIDAFMARGSVGMSAGVSRAERLRLLRIAGELETFDPVRRDAGKKTRPHPFAPYKPAEIIDFRSQGNTRSTALRRHNWMVALTFAAGCALTTSEIVHLKPEDVSASEDRITVTLHGTRPRTVVCLAVWERNVRQLLADPLVVDYLFVKDERPNDPNAYMKKFLNTVAKSRSFPSVERLRSTWIVGHLEAGTPIVALADALGVKTFSTFERLVPYVKKRDSAELNAAFRRDGTR